MMSVNDYGYLLDPFNLEYAPPLCSPNFQRSDAPWNIQSGYEMVGVPTYAALMNYRDQIMREAVPNDWRANWRQAFIRYLFFTPLLMRGSTQNAGEQLLMFYYPSPPKIRRYPKIWKALGNMWMDAVDQVASIFIGTYYTVSGQKCPALFPYPHSWFYVDGTKGNIWMSASPVSGATIKDLNKQTGQKIDRNIGEVSFVPIASIMYGGEYHTEIFETIINQVYQVAQQCFPLSLDLIPVNQEFEQFKRKYSIVHYTNSAISFSSILTQEFWAMVAWKVWWHYINLPNGYPLYQYEFGWLRSFTLYASGLQFVFPWCYDLPTNPVLSSYWNSNLSPELTLFKKWRDFYGNPIT